ncbi:class I SAM-dependent methyltransferase [Luteolibacter sp. Populi]|uniref:class I SAM-dependent methyltransferase n=1 Tax=Luteolibacter sp. Populi TaxID=3230487 RepID=UPI00346658E2
MKARGTWQGMLTVFRFNWPLYLAAGVVLLAALAGIFLLSMPWLKLSCAAMAAGAAYFIFVSLGVSHLVYDRSDLYRWNWFQRALPGMRPQRIVVCHSGFDEVSEALKEQLVPGDCVVLDHYDPALLTEPSIHKARRLFPPTPGTLDAPFDRWPVEAGSADAIFGLLAIHEFRSVEERARWFAEARRCLKPGGRIVIAEHLRDPANFLAFGPGFLHFHSAANWRRCWEMAGLRAADEFPVTPWIRFFVIVAP